MSSVHCSDYAGSFNTQTTTHGSFSMKGDQKAAEQIKIKLQAKAARRAISCQWIVTNFSAGNRNAA